MQRPESFIFYPALVVCISALGHAQWSTDTLSRNTERMAAVTVGDLAFFPGGGQGPTSPSDVVDIYDASTDTWSTTALSIARGNLASTVVGNYVLIAGGNSSAGVSDRVDIFDAQSRSWSTATLTQPRTVLAATTVGTKAFFAGGFTATNTASDVVDIYDASIAAPSNSAAWSRTTLSRARGMLAAATAGNQAIFAGGGDPAIGALADVDIYDDTTGLWSMATLSQARVLNTEASATVGNRAYFGGGQTNPPTASVMSDVVDIYDAQTGTWSTETLSVPRAWLAATAVGNQVLFAGGTVDFPPIPSSLVDVLDVGTGTWSSASLSQARWSLSATTVGSRAMFAGGTPVGGGGSNVVDVYETLNAVSYCFGDPGSGTPCPCANDNDGSVPGSGCANGAFASGARLTGSGSGLVSADTLVLTTTGLDPNNTGLYFQANNAVNGGNGNAFGDGLRCAGGGLIRLQVRTSDGDGVSSTTIALGVKGGVAPGDVKRYQCWYRDNSGGQPCGVGVNDFNLSNGYEITWLP